MSFTVTTTAFPPSGQIPREFTRDGENISPPIEWHDAPDGVRSYALIVEDPDAPGGTFYHWAAYDIRPASTGLKEGDGSCEPVTMLRMGRNDFGNSRYDGPQPPAGSGAHHYHFRLLALNVTELDVPAQSPANDIVAAAKTRCMAEAEFIGLFEKPPARPKAQEAPSRGVVHPEIADADKLARTGRVDEPVRNTPPAGSWNDVAGNE
jgi:Raf kinase inhibitor-like YbhB/YbcL family protein